MRIKSFAKVNLGLEILGKREDGYHEIRTLFQTINIFDILNIEKIPEDTILLQGDDPLIPWNQENLIYRAAFLLKESMGISEGVKIQVQKKIPHGKGLGGGSSNAAMTLFALNKLWALGLSKANLMELGVTLGSDVPYFFEGGLCMGKGRGDIITPVQDLPSFICILCFPPFPVMTADIYSRISATLTSEDKDSKIIRFFREKELGILENSLEETVFRIYPQLRNTKRRFRDLGAILTLVSGTGSVVFGVFFDREKAERALRILRRRESAVIVETISRERYRGDMIAGV